MVLTYISFPVLSQSCLVNIISHYGFTFVERAGFYLLIFCLKFVCLQGILVDSVSVLYSIMFLYYILQV